MAKDKVENPAEEKVEPPTATQEPDMNEQAAEPEKTEKAQAAADSEKTGKAEKPAEPSKEEKLAGELAALQDQYRRILAEYDNFRKRSARERESLYADAASSTVAAMLPVLDNLERALQVETQDEAFKKGVEMTARQFYDCLEKLKVTEIPAKGEQFNPELHNAVMHVEEEGTDDNTVVDVFQKGFTMNGRVVRHAMVKVAN